MTYMNNKLRNEYLEEKKKVIFIMLLLLLLFFYGIKNVIKICFWILDFGQQPKIFV